MTPLPNWYKGFTLTHAPEGKVRVRCPRGHFEKRSRSAVLKAVRGGVLRCSCCGLQVNAGAVRLLRILQAHQLATGEGMVLREMNLAFGKGSKTQRDALKLKGFIEFEDGQWWLTDEGHDALARIDAPAEAAE